MIETGIQMKSIDNAQSTDTQKPNNNNNGNTNAQSTNNNGTTNAQSTNTEQRVRRTRPPWNMRYACP